MLPVAFTTSHKRQCQLYQYNRSKTCTCSLTNSTHRQYSGWQPAQELGLPQLPKNCPSVRIGVIKCVQDWRLVWLVSVGKKDNCRNTSCQVIWHWYKNLVTMTRRTWQKEYWKMCLKQHCSFQSSTIYSASDSFRWCLISSVVWDNVNASWSSLIFLKL